MKKILIITAAFLFALVSCAKFEHDAEFQKVVTGAPVISKTDSTQTSLSAIVSAADKNASYYSYAVLKGGKSSAIDAATLLSNGYSKSAVTSACISVKDSASTKVVAEELSKGETYTLYAVAASTNGVVSEISTHVFILDDKKAPSFSAANSVWEMVDSVLAVAIPFDRDIKLAENAKVTIHGWAVHHSDHYTVEEYEVLETPADSVILSGQNLQVKENYLGIIIPSKFYISGKVVTVNFDAGTVVSLPVSEGAPEGNPCVACKSEYIEYGTGEILSSTTIGYRYPTRTFPLNACEENPKYISYGKWDQEPFMFAADSLPRFYPAISVFSEGEAQVVYTKEDAEYSSERKSTITSSQLTFSESGDTAIITLPTKPAPMEYVEIDIPEGTFADIFGNPSAEVTVDPLLTVDGTLDFAFSEVDAGCNNILSTITPGAEGLYYFASYYKGTPADSTDNVLIENAIEKIEYWAEQDGLTFEQEYLKYFAQNTVYVPEYVNLEAETAYTFYAFYMTADGTVLSGTFKQEVTTVKFEKPTQTTGTYIANGYYFSENTPGLPVEFVTGEVDTLIIRNAGYDGNQTYKFLLDESGNAWLQTTTYGLNWAAAGGTVYIGECMEIESSYAYFQSYYDQLTNTLNIGCMYFTDTYLLQNDPDAFVFDNSEPSAGPTSVKKTSGAKLSFKKADLRTPSRRHPHLK